VRGCCTHLSSPRTNALALPAHLFRRNVPRYEAADPVGSCARRPENLGGLN
jgi:hypothetical protein